MKKLSLFAILFLTGAVLSAQTADDVINRYLDAIGGKKTISKIKTLVVEGSMEIQGMEGTTTTTTLNGKGVKMELDMMGTLVVNCITDQGGWTINPFMGSETPEDIPEDQYNSAKYQMVVGGPFINYKEMGFKAELAGEKTVGDINALIVKLTSPEEKVSEHLFDTDSGYLIQTIEEGDMGENITTFSDYKEIDGLATPHNIEMNAAGGQAFIYATVEKVEVNVPVDESIFSRPEE